MLKREEFFESPVSCSVTWQRIFHSNSHHIHDHYYPRAPGALCGHWGAGLTCSWWGHLLGVGREGWIKATQVFYPVCSYSHCLRLERDAGHDCFFVCHCAWFPAFSLQDIRLNYFSGGNPASCWASLVLRRYLTGEKKNPPNVSPSEIVCFSFCLIRV